MRVVRLLLASPFILGAFLVGTIARILININTGLADIIYNIALLIALIADGIMGEAGLKMISRGIRDKYEEDFSRSEKEKYDKLYREMKKRERDEQRKG